MSQCLRYLILFLSIFCVIHPSDSSSDVRQTSIYKPLVEFLKNGYEPLAMPVCGSNKPLNVKMDMWLYQLFDLDEPTQMLTIDVWVEMSWKDCGLIWDPKNFTGLKQITIPASEIWKPDIIYYQSLHGNFEEGMFIFRESVARIRHDGMVQLGCQALLKSFCRINISKFPFDSHKCNITFASWNKDATIFNLTRRDLDNSDRGHSFSKSSNGEWDVLGFPAYDSVGRFAVGVDEKVVQNYTEVTFQLHLKRKPLYARVYLIFPCVLLTWVAALVFIIPVESGEKISFCVTILLSLIVFLLLVADNIPRSSDGIPTLGIFFSLAIGLVCFATLLTSIVLNLGMKSKEICMPRWLRKVLKGPVARLFCFHYGAHASEHKWVVVRYKKRGKKEESPGNGGESGRMVAIQDTENQDIPVASEENSQTIIQRNEWRYLGMLLDRLFLAVYLILVIILTIYIEGQ